MVLENLEKQDTWAANWEGTSEEAPEVYKNVDDVVDVSHKAGIGKLVVKVKPLGVVKG
ncbi:RtcB family protein [Candidatus Woesearchaeota archaeon]|nr:RtcB family protein [Candidatus Woesearchaeota archaeon]